MRIEPHPSGEAFTAKRVEADGRVTSYSTILYLHGEPRQFQEFACSRHARRSRRDDDD